MSQTADRSKAFAVSVYPDARDDGQLVFTFVPAECSQGAPPPQYIVTIDFHDQSMRPNDVLRSADASIQEVIEGEVLSRIELREQWLLRINALIDAVDSVARAKGWQTRRLTKKIDDREIGKHTVPGLALQKDYCQIMVETLSRAAPGAEGGIADLYLMPAYDDIASLYHYGGKWNIHYLFADSGVVARIRDMEPQPFSSEVVAALLDKMKSHAEAG